MRTIIEDRPGKVPVEEMRSAFERAVAQTDVLPDGIRLDAEELDGRFVGYSDDATNRLWVGFALAMRYKQHSGRALINLPEHHAADLLGVPLHSADDGKAPFRPDGAKLFLMVLGGTRHMTAVVPGNQLVDCYLALLGGLPAHMDARGIRDWLEDARNWAQDSKQGACRYSEELDHGVTLDFILLDSFSILGAIARQPASTGDLPDCPLPHLLHPDEAGTDPILIYAYLPTTHGKLAYTVSDPLPQP